MFLTHFDTVK